MTAAMGYPGPGMATDAGDLAGIERARAQNAASEQARNRAEARKAWSLTELERRAKMRAAGGDPGVDPKLSRIELLRKNREDEMSTQRAYTRKVGALGGTTGTVTMKLGRMTAPEVRDYVEKHGGEKKFFENLMPGMEENTVDYFLRRIQPNLQKRGARELEQLQRPSDRYPTPFRQPKSWNLQTPPTSDALGRSARQSHGRVGW